MKFQGIFGILFVTACMTASADTPDTAAFSIETYKPVRYLMQSLFVSPSFNFYTGGREDSLRLQKEKRNSVEGYGGISGTHSFRHHRVMNDLDMRTYFTANCRGSGSFSRENDAFNTFRVTTYRYPDFSCSFDHYSRYRQYFIHGMFLEGEIRPIFNWSPAAASYTRSFTRVSYGYDSTGTDALYEYSITKQRNRSWYAAVSASASAAIGYGWIAPVTSAAIVEHMIDRIAVVNGKRPSFTDDQKRRFAALLDRLLRRRVFDSRIALIETLDSITNYLNSEKVIDRETARLTMELHDIWTYGYRQDRYSGREIKCAPIAFASSGRMNQRSVTYRLDTLASLLNDFPLTDPAESAEFRSDSSIYFENNRRYTYGIRVTGGFSKPYDRFFQIDGSLECKGIINATCDTMFDILSENYLHAVYPSAGGIACLNLHWFPSIRSTITLKTTVEASRDYAVLYKRINGDRYRRWYDNLVVDDKDLFSFSCDISTGYYLSPRCSYSLYGKLYIINDENRLRVDPWTGDGGYKVLSFSCGGILSYAFF